MAQIDKVTCPICGNLGTISKVSNKIYITCPSCGKYITTDDVYNDLLLIEKKQKPKTIDDKKNTLALLAGFMCWNALKESDDYILLPETLNNILKSIVTPNSISEKVNLLMKYIDTKARYLGDCITVYSPSIYSLERDELDSIVNGLVKKSYLIDFSTDDCVSVMLTLEGVLFFEKQKTKIVNNKCFIAMWFDNSVNNLLENCINPALKATGYYPQRIDEIEFNGDITDEIIGGIRTSKFMVCDLTGYRGGVYYEAGFAIGLDKEVIFLCRKDWFSDKDENINGVHFDLNHMNIIIWDETNLEDTKKQLVNRINATIY